MCNSRANNAMTWVNSSGFGKGSGLQGGNMCEPCMSMMADSLDRFPRAKATLTIWPADIFAAKDIRKC